MKGTFSFDGKRPDELVLIPEGYEGAFKIYASPEEDNSYWYFQVEYCNGYKDLEGQTWFFWCGDFKEIVEILDRKWKDGEMIKEFV